MPADQWIIYGSEIDMKISRDVFYDPLHGSINSCVYLKVSQYLQNLSYLLLGHYFISIHPEYFKSLIKAHKNIVSFLAVN